MTTVVLTPKGIINLSTSQIGGAAKLPPKSKFQMKEVFLLSKVVVMRNTRDVNLSSSSTGSPIPGDLGTSRDQVVTYLLNSTGADTSFKFIYMLNSGETKKFYVTAG